MIITSTMFCLLALPSNSIHPRNLSWPREKLLHRACSWAHSLGECQADSWDTQWFLMEFMQWTGLFCICGINRTLEYSTSSSLTNLIAEQYVYCMIRLRSLPNGGSISHTWEHGHHHFIKALLCFCLIMCHCYEKQVKTLLRKFIS